METKIGNHYLLTYIGHDLWKQEKLRGWWFFGMHFAFGDLSFYIRVCGFELTLVW